MKFVFYAKLALTGAIILGLEIVASRILTPFFGVSLNVWSSILAVTLIALAIGYKFGGFLSNRLQFPDLVAYFAGSGAISAAWLNLSFLSYPRLLGRLADWGLVAGSIASCLYLIFVPLLLFSSLNSALIAILSNAKYSNTAHKDHNSGSVFFTSTIGSVAGIFFVTYVLLGNFSNHSVYIFLSLASSLATVLLALICVDIRKKQKIFLCISGLTMTLISASLASYGDWDFTSSTFQRANVEGSWKIIAKEPSFYGNHAVVEYSDKTGVEWRGLFTVGLPNNRIYKSGISAGHFTHALETLAMSGQNKPESVLVLGLGVGVIPTNMSKNGPTIDVVELDPKVLKIAQKYFDFDRSLVNLYLEDARTFVRRCQRKYDVVLVDLYQGDGIPPHVVSFNFFKDIRECLSDHGALVMNAIYGAKNSTSKKSLFKTLVSVYDRIVVFEASAEKGQTAQQGYILARNTNDPWTFTVSTASLPNFIAKALSPVFKNWKEYNQESKFIKNIMPIYDERNDWRRQTIDVDIGYRKMLVSKLPWQVLLD